MSTKPWKETWRTGAGGIACNNRLALSVTALATRPPMPDLESELAPRLRLAAAAPDLVRVLLAVEWHHAEWCVSCGGCKVHEPDCPLDAALRKAGVR